MIGLNLGPHGTCAFTFCSGKFVGSVGNFIGGVSDVSSDVFVPTGIDSIGDVPLFVFVPRGIRSKCGRIIELFGAQNMYFPS